jgi:hypothetical protein
MTFDEASADFERAWKIRFPDGRLSDMVNLTRAKDAARLRRQNRIPRGGGKFELAAGARKRKMVFLRNLAST